MAKQKADPKQVVAMSKLHTNSVVAKRLGISKRQVSRILARHNASKAPGERCTAQDESTQLALMGFLRDIGESYGRIGYRFGISRQAVEQKINN